MGACSDIISIILCSRSISTEADFTDAVQMCSGDDEQELISVENLLYFQDESVTMIDGDGDVFFRINAIKNDDKWYEYSDTDLIEIDFSQFEEFDANEGENGRCQKNLFNA